MIKQMKELDKLIDSIDFNQLWDGFHKTKFAIYNEHQFYINDDKGINMNLKQEEFGFSGDVDGRFMGGNTAIKIDDESVAIWNLRTIFQGLNNVKLVSLLTHEMFHCFQLGYGEKRFSDEILGIDYPIGLENITFRSIERRHLYDAVFEANNNRKQALFNQFLNIRNKRGKLLGNFINYEKALESLEGTATYVEFQALKQLTTNPEKLDLLKKYLEGLVDISVENLSIRSSTLKQGMLLCMLADDLVPDWKRKFQNSDLYLCDFIQNELKIPYREIEENFFPTLEVEKCISEWEKQRDLIFENFEKSSDKVIVNEGIQITGFDPMNILKRGNEYIHKHFVKVYINNKEKIIKGPVKMIIGEHLFDIKRMEWLNENIS